MNPIEKMKAELEAECTARKATRDLLDMIIVTAVSRIPEGAMKRNGQIVMLYSQIMNQLESLTARAAEKPDKAYNDEQSQQVLDYLTCVYAGLQAFCKQMNVEVPNGTP